MYLIAVSLWLQTAVSVSLQAQLQILLAMTWSTVAVMIVWETEVVA